MHDALTACRMWRPAVCLLLVALLPACTPASLGAFRTLAAVLPATGSSISREAVEASPYFQVEAVTGDSHAVLQLERVSGHYQYWVSAEQESLVIADGLIRRTTGLPENLGQTRFIGADPFAAGLHTITADVRSERELDIGTDRLGIRAGSLLHVAGTEPVQILGETRPLLRIDETVRAPAIGFSATNHYWIDPDDGFVWKSTQTPLPGFTVTLTALRPYRGDGS